MWVYDIVSPPTMIPTRIPTSSSKMPTSHPSIQPTAAYNCTNLKLTVKKYRRKPPAGSKLAMTYTVNNFQKKALNGLAFEINLPVGTKFIDAATFPKIKGYHKQDSSYLLRTNPPGSTTLTWSPFSLKRHKARRFTVIFEIDLCTFGLLTLQAFTYQKSQLFDGTNYCYQPAPNVTVSLTYDYFNDWHTP